MWDNRIGKRNPKAPDFKCRDRQCEGVIWHQKKAEESEPTPPPHADEDLIPDEPTPSAQSYRPPQGGRVQDALPLNDQPKKANTNALSQP